MEKEKIITSSSLHEELNKERAREGKPYIPAVNSRNSGSGVYARKDKSFSSVSDFFFKLFKGNK